MTNLLNISNTGMSAAKKQMATTAHNISNVNTEGYSRQRVELQNNRPIPKGDLIMGSGVDVKTVKRINDDLISKRLSACKSEHSYDEERSFHLDQLENIFNESTSNGLNKVVNDLFNSFRELSSQPDNETLKSVVRDKANLVCQDFHRISQKLEELENSLENRMHVYTEDVNSLLNNIKNLNIKITQLEVGGGETGDLRDQRDLAVKNLSEYFELDTFTNERGQYIVNVAGVGSLVVGGHVNELQTGVAAPDDPESSKSLQVFFHDRSAQNMAKYFKKGKLEAVHKVYNDDLYKTRNQIDGLAYNLINMTNAIHQKGYVNLSTPKDEQGNVKLPEGIDKITGIDFFAKPVHQRGSSAQINLSDALLQNSAYIAAAADPDSPGDNRIAIAITKLQNAKVLHGGTATFEEEYLKTVGNVGIESSKSKINEEQSGGILAQVESVRDRLSGVSLDEEATHMLEYQHAYEASARMMRSSDETFKALLEMLKG